MLNGICVKHCSVMNRETLFLPQSIKVHGPQSSEVTNPLLTITVSPSDTSQPFVCSFFQMRNEWWHDVGKGISIHVLFFSALSSQPHVKALSISLLYLLWNSSIFSTSTLNSYIPPLSWDLCTWKCTLIVFSFLHYSVRCVVKGALHMWEPSRKS